GQQVGLPKAGCGVTRRSRHGLAVAAKGDMGHRTLVAAEEGKHLAGLGVPEDARVVLRAGEHALAVAAECGRGHARLMPRQDTEALSRAHVPNITGVAAQCDDTVSAWTE